MKISEIGEFELINRIKNNTLFNSDDVITGIGDDTAVLRCPGFDEKWMLATTDMMIENVHFILSKDNARQIGYRAMAANVSDIAAMGGRPTHAMISIGLRPEMEVSQVELIYEGLKDCSLDFDANIVGGDTVSSPNNLVINVALMGEVDADRCLLRSGARVGDLIMVTGSLGDSSAGLDLIINEELNVSEASRDYLIQRHYFPTPRVKEVICGINAGNVSSADDISDGLGNEIYEITEASRVGAVLWFENLPISEAVLETSEQTDKDLVDYALFGGEDFEVVMTVSPGDAERIKEYIERETGTKAAIVGKIVEKSKGISLLRNNNKQKLINKGYNHFRNE